MRTCINPKCDIRRTDWQYGGGGMVRVSCACGCAGPYVSPSEVFRAAKSGEYLDVRDAQEARAFELWQDLIRRMEPGIALGEAAKELREQREGVA